MMDEQYTYGCELEWSDIDRRIDIPSDLGSWEGPKIGDYYMGSEIDIVNTAGQWRGIGTDPLCIDCTVGGEIHTVPSPDVDSQLYRIMRIMELFPKIGVACPNHGHIHVKVPGLKTDLQTVKNFFEYLSVNEEDIIRECCGFDKEEYDKIMNSDLPMWTKKYLIIGDGKHISPRLYDSITFAENMNDVFQSLEQINCEDWDCISNVYYETPNSHRTAVNMYNLLKGDTIEFRIFRASLNPYEIYSCLKFVEAVVHEAVRGKSGKSVKQLLEERRYDFPKLNYDYELAKSWSETRQTKGRCGPFKKSFSSAPVITEDPIVRTSADELTGFESGLYNIRRLCECIWQKVNITYLKKKQTIKSH